MKKILLFLIFAVYFVKLQYLSAQNTIQPSIVVWGFRTPFEFLCEATKQNGASVIELLSQEKWEKAKQNKMQVLVANGADMGIERGFCNPDFHSQLQKRYMELIPKAAENNIKMIICYSGIRQGITSEEAMKNCAEGLKPVVQLAEKHGITILMELISSNQSKALWWQHTFPHYACDNILWGKTLVEKISSQNFKLLYDVWHMNDMRANIVDDIQKYHKYIAHYHISGKERKAISENDQIDFPAVIKAIKNTGYNGFIGIEFLIEREIPESIKSAISLISK